MPSYGGSQTTGTILGKSRRKSKPPGNQYQSGKGKPKSRLRSRPPQKNVVDHIKQQNAKEDAKQKAKEDAESLKRHRRWTKEQERKERKEREAAKKEQERLEAAKRARAKKLAKKNRTNVETAVSRRRRMKSRSVSPVRDRSDLRAVVGRTGGNKRGRTATRVRRDRVHLCFQGRLQPLEGVFKCYDHPARLLACRALRVLDQLHHAVAREPVDQRQPVPVVRQPVEVAALPLDQIHLTVPALLDHFAAFLRSFGMLRVF